MRAIHALVVAVMLATAASAAALDPPDHEIWRSSMDALARARAANDADTLENQLYVLFEQALRLPATDSRSAQTTAEYDRSLERFGNLRGAAAERELLTELHELTKVDGALSSPFSIRPVVSLMVLTQQVGDFDGARELMRDLRARAESELGANHGFVSYARVSEARIAAAGGDVEYAVTQLESLLADAARMFGPSSREYTGVLLDLVRAHHFGDDVAAALELLDRGSAVTGGESPDVYLLTSFANAYAEFGKYDKAAQLLERAEKIYLDRFKGATGYEAWLFELYKDLTYAQLRTGDSGPALDSMFKAVAVAESVESRRPDLALEAAYLSLDVAVRAGESARIDRFIEVIEARAVQVGRAETRRHRERMAALNLEAGHYERTVKLAESLMKEYEPASASYANAAEMLVRAKARQNPPVALVELAEQVAAINRRAYAPSSRALAAASLAESYAAAGRFDEAVALMRAGIERQLALHGEEVVAPSTWVQYARLLRGAGRQAEAGPIVARVSDFQSRLTADIRARERLTEPVTHNSDFGFSVVLDDPLWTASAGIVISAFTATYRNQAANVTVVPVLLTDGFDAANAEQVLIKLVQLSAVTREPWSRGQDTGFQFRYERSVGARLVYRSLARFVVEPEAIYLLIASANKALPDAVAAAERALDNVRFDAEPVRSDALSAESRAVHGQMLNHLGVWHYERGQLEQALAALQRARTFHESDQLFQNMALVQLELGRWRDVIATVDAYPSDLAAAPGLRAWRAFSRTQLATTDSDREAAATAAIDDYAAAFAGDYVDDDAAYEYVSLLIDADRAADASQFLATYGASNPSPNVIALDALVALKMEDEVALDEKLALLEDATRSSADAVLIGALVQYQRGGVQALASFADRVDAAGLDSVELYQMLGNYQIEAELYKSARDTFERALALAPGDEDLEAMRDYAQSLIRDVEL
jgi:tetratricopeptide (TPR) repeat protein